MKSAVDAKETVRPGFRSSLMDLQTIVSRNPASGEILATLPVTPPEVLPEYFDRARSAQRLWAQLPLKSRAARLLDLRELVIDQRLEIAQLISSENGKPVFEALSAEILPVVDLLTFYSKSAAKVLRPYRIPMGLLKHRKSRIEYWPLGVVGVISPWNYPFLLPFGEIAPILVAGNAVIFKPSEVTSQIGLKIQELMDLAGIPQGLVQTIIGSGALGQAMIDCKPDKVFFTGSVSTGKKVMSRAAEKLIPVNLELGGKDAMIILDDADLDYATSCALWGGFSNSGQVCASTERVLVHERIAPEFKRRLKEKASKLRAGEPLDPNTDLGAVTFERQKLVYQEQISEAEARGAEFSFGAHFSDNRTRLAPTLVTGAMIEDLQIYREETFGPVLAMTTFNNDREAILKANQSKYGLLASVITSNLDRGRKVASRLEVGTVTINEVLYTAGVGETPWGGVKDSGMGRSHGSWGLLEAVNVRHVHEPRFSRVWFKSPWWFPYSKIQFDLFDGLLQLYRRSYIRKIPAALRLGIRAVRFFTQTKRL